jgi:transcription antitermination factor NusG
MLNREWKSPIDEDARIAKMKDGRTHLAHKAEHFLPLYRTHRKWSDGSRVTLDLPLFPSYIFVRIQRAQRIRVLEVSGVLAFVDGTGGEPVSLPEDEIDALGSSFSLRNARPHPLLKVGQRVRIRSGAFAGMEGVVVRMKYRYRVVLTLDSIMQSFAMEVDGEDLELMNPDIFIGTDTETLSAQNTPLESRCNA